MSNGISVKDNLVSLIAKIGEKLQLGEQNFSTIITEQIFLTFIQQLKKE